MARRLSPPRRALSAAVSRHAPPHGARPRRDRRFRSRRVRRRPRLWRCVARRLSPAGRGTSSLHLARGGRSQLVPSAPGDPAAARSRVDRQLGGRGAHCRARRIPDRARQIDGARRARPRRPLPRGGKGRAGRCRHRLRRLLAELPRAGGFCGGPHDRAYPASPLCRGIAGDSDDPGLRGPGLRHPARIGAVAGPGRPVHAGRGLPRCTRRRSDAASPCRVARRSRFRRGARRSRAGDRHGAPQLRSSRRRAHRDLPPPWPRIGAPGNGGSAMSCDIAFFGSSLVSAYWNGAATYYRGVLQALAANGHRITFYEPDAFDRQKHRDIPDPDWARIVVYPATEEGVDGALEQARNADLLVKASGVGVFDRLLEERVPGLRRDGALAAFWDVDAPATLERMEMDPADPFHALVPQYDIVFTYGGGPPVIAAYEAFGARVCVPVYNGLDPSTHHPATPEPRFGCDLGLVANRLPDRERRIEEFFLAAAAARHDRRFLLAGAGWDDKPMPKNVGYIGHLYTADHNAFNASCLAVLNVSRDSIASNGYSPATRVFEAADIADVF